MRLTGLWFGVWGFGFWLGGLGFRVEGFGFFGVRGCRYRVSGFRVEGCFL